MKLNIGRSCHRCIFTKIENSEVILVTGGIIFDGSYVYDNSVEIINVQTGSVTLSFPMNIKRACHGNWNFEHQKSTHDCCLWWCQ